MTRIVGIDFGTTNSVVAAMEGGEPVTIPNSRGDRLTPSVAGFDKNGEVLIGAPAKNQAVIHHERTVLSVKRRLGETEPLQVAGKTLFPEQVAALILRKLRLDAEAYLGGAVKEAVIAVPAYFNDLQRQAVKEAARLAGMTALRLINEPTAAVLAYGLPRSAHGLILAFDLGGGTFDVSILDVRDGKRFETLATRGDNRLGGDDFDEAIAQWACSRFKAYENIDLRNDRMAMQKVREAAEAAKKELSEREAVQLAVPFIASGPSGPRHLNLELTRTEYEELIGAHLARIGRIVDMALSDAGVQPGNLSAVILVGGASRTPAVRKRLEGRFDPEKIFRCVNPDETVALGAAIQAGLISGQTKGLVLVDVTPLTLGVAAENDLFVPVIERNTSIPTRRSRVFTTVSDGQTEVEIHIHQGERRRASANIPIGKFLLSGIPKAPKGTPRIEVAFSIDADGLLHVEAKDDREAAMGNTVVDTRDARLTGKRIQNLVDQANSCRESDLLFERKARLTRIAKSFLDRLKKMGDGLSSLETGPMAGLAATLERAMYSEDLDLVDDAVEAIRVEITRMSAR